MYDRPALDPDPAEDDNFAVPRDLRGSAHDLAHWDTDHVLAEEIIAGFLDVEKNGLFSRVDPSFEIEDAQSSDRGAVLELGFAARSWKIGLARFLIIAGFGDRARAAASWAGRVL